ncbi:hypothetical protein APE_2065.1 [Aeropyrum pernix K1]|uniref:Uncharacterized protein n=1 Tax=Aeropyrum pernix (strain ATCC 700893 / DSM 11879 / JCM 9820 / NBRC 100138 / K1) TaxID=272557 RepID=Q9YA74_AERPE|nr:hypothetical protein APE_2065.1 [Aeropyrum pernix K1]
MCRARLGSSRSPRGRLRKPLGGFPREPRGHRVRFINFKPYKFYWGFPNMSYITKRYGLDRHSTSAYLIALRGIERYSPIQKVTA